jgi:Bacteriophage head to tail connecting protein
MVPSKRKNFELLRQQLENERATFLQHWRDLSDFILPRRARFTVTDVNKGDRRNQKIIDSTATLAARSLRSGMMSGITSPARPWFRLSSTEPGVSELASVKEWLDSVTRLMSTVFLKSNIYNVLPTLYGDLGVFGTSAVFIEEDTEEVIRCYPFPIGSYYIANDNKLRVRVFYREFNSSRNSDTTMVLKSIGTFSHLTSKDSTNRIFSRLGWKWLTL